MISKSDDHYHIHCAIDNPDFLPSLDNLLAAFQFLRLWDQCRLQNAVSFMDLCC